MKSKKREVQYQITVNQAQLVALRHACELLARCCLYESESKTERSQIVKDIVRYHEYGNSVSDAARDALDRYTFAIDNHRTPWDLMQVFRYQLWNDRTDKPSGWGGTDSNVPMTMGLHRLPKIEKLDGTPKAKGEGASE